MLSSFSHAVLATLVAAAIAPVAKETPHNASAPVAAPTAAASLSTEHRIYGTVQSVQGNALTLRTRSGRVMLVDRHAAKSFVAFAPGRPIIVYGAIGSDGVLHASAIWRTYPDAAHWPADR